MLACLQVTKITVHHYLYYEQEKGFRKLLTVLVYGSNCHNAQCFFFFIFGASQIKKVREKERKQTKKVRERKKIKRKEGREERKLLDTHIV